MKRHLLLILLIIPSYLFAQSDTLQSPTLTWKDRKEPLLAGGLSYFCPGAGQIYNKEYEKALGVVSVLAYSYLMMYQGVEVDDEGMVLIAGVGMAGAWAYSVMDAILSAKRINYDIDVQLRKYGSLSLKPDFQLTKKSFGFGKSSFEPVLGLRLKLSL